MIENSSLTESLEIVDERLKQMAEEDADLEIRHQARFALGQLVLPNEDLNKTIEISQPSEIWSLEAPPMAEQEGYFEEDNILDLLTNDDKQTNDN